MRRISKILFFIPLSFIFLSAYPQRSEEDSIRQSYAGSNSAELYEKLFDYYSSAGNNIAECYADSMLTYAQVNSLPYYEVVAYCSKGILNYKNGNYELALDCYEKAEPIAREIGDAALLFRIYNEFGNIYYEKGEVEVSLKYYDLAIDNAKASNDYDSYAIVLSNIAGNYFDDGEYETALKLYDSALNITDDIDIKIAIYYNVAEVQNELGNVSESENTYSKLLEMLDESTDVYICLLVLNKLSYLYIIEENYDKAEEYLNRVDSISALNPYSDTRLTMYKLFHDMYFKIGDYERAELYSQKLGSLQDSLIAIDNTKKLNELEKQNLRERNELEMKHRDEEIRFQKTINLILCGVVALVVVFVVIIAFMLVRKSRLNKMLNMLNSDLKQRDEEISSNLEYAREIQLGCMSNSLTESSLQMFVLDRPKVVVGGDFYILQSKGDASYVVVGDCTGHGISGGFLSVLGIKSVYAAIEKYDSLPEMASFINNEFCEIVSSAENLKGESLCLSMLRICGNELRFLGSKQKMWLVSGDSSSVSQLACAPDKYEVREYKSANAIMGNSGDEVFKEEIVTVKSGDVVFLSSDGYPDQFGKDGKLKYSRFRNLLLECSQMKPDKAREFLSEKLDLWRGELEQTDDVTIVGVYF